MKSLVNSSLSKVFGVFRRESTNKILRWSSIVLTWLATGFVLFEIFVVRYKDYFLVMKKHDPKILYTAFTKSISLPFILAIFGIIGIVEKLFKINESHLRATYRTLLIISAILILVILLSSPNLYSQDRIEVEINEPLHKSVITNFKLNNRAYEINLDFANSIQHLDSADKNKIQNVIEYFESLFYDFYFLSESGLISDKIYTFSQKYKHMAILDSLLSNPHLSVIDMLKLQILDVSGRLIILDTYFQNLKIMNNQDFPETVITPQEALVEIISKIDNYLENVQKLVQSISENNTFSDKNLSNEISRFKGTMYNLRGISKALSDPALNEYDQKRNLVKKVNEFYGELRSVLTVLDSLNEEVMLHKIAITEIDTILSQSRAGQSQLTYNINKQNYNRWLGPLDDNILITGSRDQKTIFFTKLRNQITLNDSLIGIQLIQEEKKYLPYLNQIAEHNRIIQESILYQTLGSISIKQMHQSFNLAVNLKSSKIDTSLAKQLLLESDDYLVKAIQNLKNRETFYNNCKKYFDNSYSLYSSVPTATTDSLLVYTLKFMPRFNTLILGLNYNIPVVKFKIENLPDEVVHYYMEAQKNIKNVVHQEENRKINNLVNNIQSTRIYFETNSEELTEESEALLPLVRLDLMELLQISKTNKEDIRVKIIGHNGISKSRYETISHTSAELRFPLRILAAGIGINRSNTVYNKLLNLGNDTINEFRHFLIPLDPETYWSERNSFIKNGVLGETLEAMVFDVAPFKVIEQSVTFQVLRERQDN